LAKIELKKTERRRSNTIVTTPLSPFFSLNQIDPHRVEETEKGPSKVEVPRENVTHSAFAFYDSSFPVSGSDSDTEELSEETQPNQDFSFFKKLTKTIAENKNASIALTIISCFTLIMVMYFYFSKKKDKSS